MRHSSRRSIPFAVVTVCCVAVPALAASSAELRGRVADKAGTPLPGVTLVLRNDGLAVAEQGAVTDVGGNFRFPSLPPGKGYRLRASLPGYATVEFSDLDLTTGQTPSLEILLRPATEVQETVRVRGRTDVVDTESVTTSTTFTSEFVAGLPLLGRDYQEILTLAPGVTDIDQTGNPNIHGARDTGVVTLVDGVSTTDPLTGHFGQELNIESIEEIEVITSGVPAEYSRAQGGFVNIITKSGGNEFKGTFKLFVRSNRLDGDGAGIDPPETSGGFPGAKTYRELSFTDLKPFLSLSGPLLRDRVWYYLTTEYIQVEDPLNVLTEAFVRATYGHREFGKVTWQARPDHKLAFSLTLDHHRDENQGIASLTDVQSGYTAARGGPTYTLKEISTFTPNVLLESTLSWFDNRFRQTPTMDPDTNGNGILFVDDRPDLGGNQDGIFQARERDPGDDWDRDRAYDIFEDLNRNLRKDSGEDLDGDGRLTAGFACEGADHEDITCDGDLDREFDLNQNGSVDPEEDLGLFCPHSYFGCHDPTAGNGRFDIEDRNGNGRLDTYGDSGYTPFPFWVDRNGNGRIDYGEYRAPLPPDQDQIEDQNGRIFGPNPYEHDDHRKRLTLSEAGSLFVERLGGTHDLEIGAVYEHEGYDANILLRPRVTFPSPDTVVAIRNPSQEPDPAGTETGVVAFLGVPPNVNNVAVGDNVGLFLQDTYKPLPNLTLGLGLRFDFESLRSFGYTQFDPRAERQVFDALMNLAGVDTFQFDGVRAPGLCTDPLYDCSSSNLHLAQISSALKEAAPRHLTQHNSVVEVKSPFLRNIAGTEVDFLNFLRAGANPRRREAVRIKNSNLAPRLSLSWDPWADGKTKGFASWSRLYDKLFLGSIILEEGPDTVARVYTFDADGSSLGIPNDQIGSIITQSTPSAFQVERGLKTPYTDELTVGFQREIAPEVSVSLTYIKRNYRDQLQDVDLNHRRRVDPATGLYADQFGGVLCGQNARDCVNRADGLPDLQIQNFFFNRILRLGNYNDQTYRGWEVELVRRLRRRWQMEANYTYSKALGDAEGHLSGIGNDPALSEFEPGYLDYDQRHVFKLSALAYLPGDWRLGGTAQWASGLPYSYVFDTEAVDDVGFSQPRQVYGRIFQETAGFIRETRNIHRNHAVYDFNARVEKNLVLGKSAASAFFEIFNILNTDDLRIYTVEDRVVNPINPYVIEQVNAERRFGRRFQVGIRLDF